MDNEIINIYIWQLSEKTDNIDKSKDYTIIHDGSSVKKVKMQKIYDYFNQDYKVDNTVKYFDTLLETENRRYDILYSDLESSILSYEEIIKILVDKFTNTRDKLRRLETSSNQNGNDIISISESFEDIKDKFNNISENLDEYTDTISNMNSKNKELDKKITSVNEEKDSINNIESEVRNNNTVISQTISRVSNSIDNKINGSTLVENIDKEYDKILSILDHYHHITH